MKRLILFISLVLFLSCCSTKPGQSVFNVIDGLKVRLIASEPIIRDPVDLAFTPTGTMLVLEMPGYPDEVGQSRIVALIDTNSDGDYDESRVFADNLMFATSMLPWRDGVLVAAPPFLLHLKDLDLDGHAETRDTLMGGFAMENLQHNFNGLTHGLDGWIYAANGGNSGSPYWWGDSSTRIDLRDDDFRFNLKERKIERVGQSSGGHGLAMDEFGRWFSVHNLTHVSQLVFPSRYYTAVRIPQDHTLVNISDHEENGLARIYPVGEQETRVNHPEQSGYFSGACGITWYGDSELGPTFKNSIWVADVVLNLIHADKLTTKGTHFNAGRIIEDRDVIASEDRAFRPVKLVVGPEGAIYLIDMHRQVIEHPEWIPDEIEKQLDLSKGRDQGRIYRITRNDTPTRIDFKTFSTEEGLVQNLQSPFQWMRMTAQRLLAEREIQPHTLQLLRSLTSDASPVTRLHAYWTLHHINRLLPEDIISALKDNDPAVRENALIIAEDYLHDDFSVFDRCIDLMQDENPRTRMQAALTLSVAAGKDLDMARRGKLLDAIVLAAEKGGDQWNTTALTIASKGFPADVFLKLAAAPSVIGKPELLTSLAVLCGERNSDAYALLENLSDLNLPTKYKSSIIKGLALGELSSKEAHSFIPIITRYERDADDRMLTAFASLRNRLGLPQSPRYLTRSSKAINAISDRSLPDSIRLELMSVIALLPLEKKAAVLYACLEHREPLSIQESAIRQLAGYADKTIGVELISRWKSLGPQARKWASDLLIYREIHHDALLTGLENGTINLGEMNFDLERRRALISWTDDADIRRRAGKFFSDEGVTTRKEAIEKMKPSLQLKGIAAKGAVVYESMCSACHRYGKRGNDVGPVLTEISRKSKESILHDILDPNAAVDTKYISHRLETEAGEVYVGIIEAESDIMLALKKTGGEKIVIQKRNLKSLQSLGSSLMPEGLEANLSVQELADLLEFLRQGD